MTQESCNMPFYPQKRAKVYAPLITNSQKSSHERKTDNYGLNFQVINGVRLVRPRGLVVYQSVVARLSKTENEHSVY